MPFDSVDRRVWLATVHGVTKSQPRLSFFHAFLGASQVVPVVKKPHANTGDARDVVQSLCQEDPLEKEVTTHSSILAWENPTDRGAWQATVYEAAKSRTGLTTHAHVLLYDKHHAFLDLSECQRQYRTHRTSVDPCCIIITILILTRKVTGGPFLRIFFGENHLA